MSVTGRLAPAHSPKAMTPTPIAAAQELGLAQPLRVFGVETWAATVRMGE